MNIKERDRKYTNFLKTCKICCNCATFNYLTMLNNDRQERQEKIALRDYTAYTETEQH